MGFLDFIFDNFFIVLIIAFGILNLFNRLAKGEQREQGEQQTESRQPRREGEEAPSSQKPQGNVLGRMANSLESAFEEISGQFEEEKPRDTIAAQQQKQYEQMKQEVQQEYAEYTDEAHPALKKQTTSTTEVNHSSHIGKIDKKRLMTRQGLVEGVIMSEVLGPPRALKPYRSVIAERRR